MRILHVITALNLGGAEAMLHRLAVALRERGHEQEIVSLVDAGPTAERLRRDGFGCHVIGMRRSLPEPSRLVALVRLVRRLRPDVVQTWMYHADLLGGLAAKLAGDARIVWGVHHTTLETGSTRWTTRATMALCARLSGHVPDAIVCVSNATRAVHLGAGYAAHKLEVVPNGFDLRRYAPDEGARRELRRELGIDDGTPLVGLVARFHPQKDHLTFVRAAAALARRVPDARFLLCGTGVSRENAALTRALAEADVSDRCFVLGERADMPRVMNALDVATLSSASGEAFPLVIGEAMACGTPCAVTDVGDSAELVGDTGKVVPPRDVAALASAVEALLALGRDGRRRLGAAARARVEARYALPRVVRRYEELYARVAARGAAVGPPAGERAAR